MKTVPYRPVRVLVSARDPAAAHNMAAICHGLGADPRFELLAVAQDPATRLLAGRGLAVRALPALVARDAGDAAARELLRLADELLAELQPDVVVVGLSSPSPAQAGIDEALLARRRTPALLVQDFWGEQNNFFGRPPDVAVALDDLAARLTVVRHGTATCVAGSPRHAEYAAFDSATARARVRQSLGERAGADGAPVFGLFGQPLHELAGYHTTLRAWCRAVEALQPHARVFYRPHPRESAAQVATTRRWFDELALPHVLLEKASPEEALAACDVACTIFSNCAYDAAYLNRFSAAPLVVPMLLLFDPQMRAILAAAGDWQQLPYVSQGLTLPVWDEADLAASLADAVSTARREAVWRAARDHLPDPTRSVSRIGELALELAMRADARKATPA